VPALLGILYIGIGSTAIAFFLWNKSFELLDAATASLFFFAQPVVGTLLAAIFRGEQLGWSFFAGGALILLGACWDDDAAHCRWHHPLDHVAPIRSIDNRAKNLLTKDEPSKIERNGTTCKRH
jgi:hypothetical protein